MKKFCKLLALLSAEALLVALLVLVMGLLLREKTPRADVTAEEAKEAFLAVKGEASVLEAGPLRIRRIFGLDAADDELAVYYTPAETMDVCEFFLVRGSEDAADAAESAMRERLASQLAAFDHYGEHQTELLQKAVVYRAGDYACLIVSETPGAWLDAVKKLLEV